MKKIGLLIAFFGCFSIYAATWWPTLTKTPTGTALSGMGFILIISGISIAFFGKKK